MNHLLKMPKSACFIILLLPLFLSKPTYASNEDIAMWTQSAIINTLSISYANYEKKQQKTRPYYTHNAWKALGDFLGQYVKTVKDEKLTLHPIANGPASIVTSGIVENSNFFAGIKYWEVQQEVQIPELALRINFVALVISLKPGEYLIASLDMTIL